MVAMYVGVGEMLAVGILGTIDDPDWAQPAGMTEGV